MKSLRTGVLALLALGVTGANAGGLGERGSIKDGPYAAPFSWTGFYVGATAGAASGESRFENTTRKGTVVSNPFDINGFTAGATIGYNFQLTTNWVVGIEADISHSGISGSFSGNLGQPNGKGFGCSGDSFGPCVTNVNWFGTVRGRIGYAVNTLLLYGTGGLAYGEVESGVKNHTEGTLQVSDTNFGWTAGVGFEYAFAANWSAKVEYLHVDLGWTDQAPAIEGLLRSDAKFDVVRAGLNYRFGN